jgi:hypothetical protein
MWIENLGSGRAAGKILAFLSEKHGMKFTRSRIWALVQFDGNR